MLSISNLEYRIAGRPILSDINLTVQNGWKLAVIGANGAGKSTLFKLIMNELEADGGEVDIQQNASVGMVRQDLPEDNTPLIDIVLAADKERESLLQAQETETDPFKIAEIHSRLQDIDAYAAPAKAATILAGLGFDDSQLEDPISSLSGGWRMRVALAAVLFQEPDILLLDEPTNHLDLDAIMWLETYLQTYPHTMLLISHDRELLNTCVDHVAHIENQQITLYTGTYDDFERERAEKQGLQEKLRAKQEAKRAHIQSYVDRFRYKASKAKQAQSRLKALEKMDIVDEAISARSVAFNFPKPEELPPPLISLDNITLGYGDNVVLRHIHDRIDMDDRIALLGANGNGKSTLIKCIAGALEPLKGELNVSEKLRVGYFAQHQTEQLNLDGTPFQEMAKLMGDVGETKVRARLGQFGFSKPLADNKISELSGGEKARLLFALMSYDAPHVLLLDEPTNHLDIDAREALVKALNGYDGAIILVSHDPTMVERVADKLWLVKDGECSNFDGNLDDYKKFILTEKRAEKRAQKAKKKAKQKAAQEAEAKERAEQDRNVEIKKRKKFPDLVKQIDTCEKELKKLIKQKKALEEEMAEPSFYDDSEAAQKAQQKHNQFVQDIATAEEKWLEAQETFDSQPLEG